MKRRDFCIVKWGSVPFFVVEEKFSWWIFSWWKPRGAFYATPEEARASLDNIPGCKRVYYPCNEP